MAVPNANEAMRRRLVWAAVLLLVVGVTGWFVYRAVAESRREEARQREDAERLRMIRYRDVIGDLEMIGDAGDEATRTHCRHALQLLEAMESYHYRSYRADHPAPDWLNEPSAEKQ
jgi:hypothetical protein